VAASDPRAEEIRELDDVAVHELNEIAHFFAIYKQLEPGKTTVTQGWQDREAAEAIIEESRRRFREG
jgi:inorganic pyrophosphatase